MESKRICLVHHTSLNGGGTESLIDVARLLIEQGNHVTVVLPPTKNEKVLETEGVDVRYYQNIPVLPVYSGGPSLFSRTMLKELLNLFNTKNFAEYIDSFQFDIVILNSAVLSVVAKYMKSKCFCFVRECLNRALYRRLFCYVDKLLFISEHEMNKHNLLDKSEYVPDFCVEDSIQKTDSRCEIAFLGGKSKMKGFDVMLKAFKMLPTVYELYVWGSDEDRDDGRIHYRKYADRGTIYSSCSVVVFPATKPHQARPAIECGMYECPIVLTEFDCYKHEYKDGENCVMFGNGDYEDLADKIVKVLCNDWLYSRLVENNRNTYLKRHTKNYVSEVLKRIV